MSVQNQNTYVVLGRCICVKLTTQACSYLTLEINNMSGQDIRLLNTRPQINFGLFFCHAIIACEPDDVNELCTRDNIHTVKKEILEVKYLLL